MSKTIIYRPPRLQNGHISPSPYNLLRRITRWLRQIRHRQGYGVHSPLAFNFITDVIYNREAYYAYQKLAQPLTASITRLGLYDPDSGLTEKDLRLLFRIANHQQAHHICITTHTTTTATNAIQAYICAACPSAELVDDPAEADLIYTDTPPHPTQSAITFDLGRLHIHLIRHKITPQHYVINYF